LRGAEAAGATSDFAPGDASADQRRDDEQPNLRKALRIRAGADKCRPERAGSSAGNVDAEEVERNKRQPDCEPCDATGAPLCVTRAAR
jgi:hypothetical protein